MISPVRDLIGPAGVDNISGSSAALIDKLREYRGNYVSGTSLGEALGLSRAAVWKQVEVLRRRGYKITARQNRGYCLIEEPSILDCSLFQGKKIIYHRSVDSTNLVARRLAERCEDELTVVSEEQTAGRGRLGRSWYSPPGCGLWFSILLRPSKISPAGAAPITLVTAAVIAHNLHILNNLSIGIKWPNDLIVERKKVGGILTEIKAEPDRIEYLVVGVGLNVNRPGQDFPPDLTGQATFLAPADRPIDRTGLFLNLREDLLEAYRRYFRDGFTPFHQLWVRYNITLGNRVKILTPAGSLEGQAEDLTSGGFLVLRDSRGHIHHVSYGEVNHEC